jgi:hypothetical protein
MNEKDARFKDSMTLESALMNLLGKKYYGSAGVFSDPQICKKFLLRAIRRIRKRLNEIVTTDERLLFITNITLDSLEHNVKTTSEKKNDDWFIIADFLYLVSLLLGYDYQDGKVHRHIIFYQNRMQETENYIKKVGRAFWDEFPKGDLRIKYEIVYLLKKRKLPNNQIARILTISDKLVAKILKRIEQFEKESGRSFPQYLNQLKSK